MKNMSSWRQAGLLVILVVLAFASSVFAVSVEDALRYVPVQKDVDYSRPSATEIKSCKIGRETIAGKSALVVRGPAGQLLRSFSDANSDGKVDIWSYYADGIESYRDIDSNFNGKADQYRWLGVSGIRWGVDTNEDGNIDRWNQISPEEITAEVLWAIRDKDVARFSRLLMNQAELDSLGLSKEMSADFSRQLKEAPRKFQAAAARQRLVDARSKWIHFGASKPGIMPEGASGNTKDVYVYENVSAMLESGAKTEQVAIGTLFRVGSQWRMMNIPTGLMDERESSAAGAFLYNAANLANVAPPQPSDALSEEMQALVDQVDKIERKLATATGKQRAELYDQESRLLRELAAKSKTQKEQSIWIKQLADTLSTAVQAGEYDDGVDRLNKLQDELARQSKKSDLTRYVTFKALTANYAAKIQDPEASFPKVQDWWLENLEEYVSDYPTGDEAIEAMLQLAIAEEFAGNEKPAIKWYDKIIADGGDALEVRKAVGAKRRLTSVGQPLAFGGKTADGRTIQVRQLRGKYIALHYWATWCEPCKADIATLGKLVAKYGNDFRPIGVNIDNNRDDVVAFLKKNRLPWPQVYEGGGLDSRPAVELGILTVPTMMLIDDEGKVVNRNIHITELEEYLAKYLDDE